MGKWIHRLSNVNKDNATADCANCGNGIPVRVKNGKAVCRVSNREQRRKYVRKPHGLTLNEAARVRENAECWICQSTTKLVVDHCHSTGVIRGVLCSNCNTALGMFKDDLERLTRGIEYLSNPPGVPSVPV